MASEEEFADFVAAALPALLRFGHALAGNSASAEDLVQTALARSLRAWRVRQIDDPYAYVRKVMVNSYATWYRKYGSRERLTASSPLPEIAEDHTVQIDDRDAVRRALLLLPARQRTVIVLRYYEDLSEREIAGLMATSIGTVKSQAARALSRLANELDSQEADDLSNGPEYEKH